MRSGSRLGEDFLELVDDQQHTVVVGLGGQAGSGCGRQVVGGGTGQAPIFQLREKVMPRSGIHGQPAVAARERSLGQGRQNTRVDQRRLPRSGGPSSINSRRFPPSAASTRSTAASRPWNQSACWAVNGSSPRYGHPWCSASRGRTSRSTSAGVA